MNSTDLTATSFLYIDCDIPEGKTLLEWRADRDTDLRAQRAAKRRVGRIVHLRRLPRLRSAW